MEQAKDLLVLVVMMSCVGGLFFMLSRLGLRAAMKKLEARPAPDLNQFFDAETAAMNPLVIYFHSNTCPACNQVTPLIDKLRGEFDNVIKINCSDNKEAARAFFIFGTPTVLQIVNGQMGKIVVGKTKEKVLREMVVLPPPETVSKEAGEAQPEQ